MDISVEGFGPALNACLTSLAVSGQVNAQFTHMLKRLIYVYVFGERLGDLQLGGVIFPRRCAGPVQPGHVHMQRYYDAFNLAATGRPIKVTVGALTYEAFLIAHQIGTSDPVTSVGSFTLLLHKSPRRPVNVAPGQNPVATPPSGSVPTSSSSGDGIPTGGVSSSSDSTIEPPLTLDFGGPPAGGVPAGGVPAGGVP